MPKRRRPAHPSPIDRHNCPVILMVTVVTRNRSCVLANPQAAAALTSAWSESDRWVVGSYLIMPDHLHLFCAPGTWARDTVTSWVAYWKRQVAHARPELKSAFLYGCWDTQMRNQDHYVRKLDYVALNPVRRGLVENAEDWPYRGHLNELAW
jgi:putative transposase